MKRRIALWLEAWGAAFRPFVRRPVRSLLLLQGTIWGVAVAVFPSAVLEGTRVAALSRGRALGADRVAIAPDPTALEAAPLRYEDARRLRAEFVREGLAVRSAGGVRLLALETRDGRTGAVVGADAGAIGARGLVLAEGRWLHAGDGPGACVVESRAGAFFAGRELVPGDTIRVPVEDGAHETLTVVGVTEPQDEGRLHTNDLGFDVRHPLYQKVGRGLLLAMGLPVVDDAWKRSDALVYVRPRGPDADWLLLSVDTPDVRRAARRATSFFATQGRAALVFHPFVLPFLLGREVDRFLAVRVALFLACLTMGAVVMANLGLLVALRRSREIAIRRAEGATRARIATRFLGEGLALTFVGSVVGCGVGMALAALRVALEPVAGFSWVFPWQHALVAVGVSIVVGAAVSVVPAWRAARISPAQAFAEETS